MTMIVLKILDKRFEANHSHRGTDNAAWISMILLELIRVS